MPRRLEDRTCVICGARFKSRKRATFCSKSCIWKATKGVEYNRDLTRKHAKANAGKRRGTGNGYIKRNGRHEHRVVAEQTLGRSLKPGEVVHHIDRNPQNNDPCNLAVMTRAEHMREHGLGIPGRPLPWKPWEKRKAKENR